jgi:hypothetical protein
MTVAEVVSACPGGIARWDWGDEGIPEAALFVRVGDGIVEVLFEDSLSTSRAFYVTTEDTLFRTPERLGVGSTLLAFSARHGTPALQTGECALYATFSDLAGVSFRLKLPPGVDCEDMAAFISDPSRVPQSTTVQRAHLFRRDAGA